jgi:hypothetical protein
MGKIYITQGGRYSDSNFILKSKDNNAVRISNHSFDDSYNRCYKYGVRRYDYIRVA